MARTRKALKNMSLEELNAHADELAEQKRAIKAEEREVAAMLEARAALEALSSEAAKLVSIKLDGGITVSGSADTEVN